MAVAAEIPIQTCSKDLVEVRILVINEIGPGGIIAIVDRTFWNIGHVVACKEPKAKKGVVWISGIFPELQAQQVMSIFFNNNGTIREEYAGKVLAKK